MCREFWSFIFNLQALGCFMMPKLLEEKETQQRIGNRREPKVLLSRGIAN